MQLLNRFSVNQVAPFHNNQFINGFTTSHSFKPATSPLTTVRHYSPRNRSVFMAVTVENERLQRRWSFGFLTVIWRIKESENVSQWSEFMRSRVPVSCRNHSKPHLRPTIPTADRNAGLLDNPGLFPSFPSERLNGVRSSPPTRLPTSQPRTRLPSTSAFPRRDTVGTGRVTEPTTTDYSLGIGRGRYSTAPTDNYPVIVWTCMTNKAAESHTKHQFSSEICKNWA